MEEVTAVTLILKDNEQLQTLIIYIFYYVLVIYQHQQQQQQPFNDLCSGTTPVGWYQKKHSAFCLSIGLCCDEARFPHLLSSGFLWSRGR